MSRAEGPAASRRRSRSRPKAAFVIPALALFAAAFPREARADDAPDASEVKRLREELDAERRARAEERAELERRLSALEKQQRPTMSQDEIGAAVESYMQEKDLFDAAPRGAVIPSAGNLIDVSVILDAHFGTSTATDAALSRGIALGDHDPHVRGANVRNEEIVMSADVDPYFYGFLDIVYKIDEEGESTFELEEAYGLTTALPAHLQLKFGQFFTEFGRANPTHPHAWEFHDYPVILGRVFGGDGLRGQGMRLAWDLPLCSRCPVKVLAGWQNARGETQASFLGVEGDAIGEHELQHRDVANLTDLAYHGRIEMSCDEPGRCGSTFTWLAGLSAAIGPNSTGPNGYTHVLGADFYLKWRPKATDAGWPWVAWQTEAVYRDYHADRQHQSISDGLGGTTDVLVGTRDYEDWGLYSQVVWGFKRPWSIGGRIDYADSDGAFEGSHFRASLALSYYPSEFSRIRLQAQYDHVDGLSSAFPGDRDGNFSIWLGFDLSLGKHGAHKF